MIKCIEADGSGAHRRRHAEEEGLEQTTNISYAPTITSFELLHKATKHHLTNVENKVEGKDFAVPSMEWVRRQFSPSRVTSAMAESFTGRLPFKRVLQSKDSRAFHGHAHYVAAMKKIWRDHLSALRRLYEDRLVDLDCLDDDLP